MSSHLHISQSPWMTKVIKQPEQGSAKASADLFQYYMDKGIGTSSAVSPEKLTPAAIRSLAANLISALERASMHMLFSDEAAATGTSDAGFISTDLFMAMRNSVAQATKADLEHASAAPSPSAPMSASVPPQPAVRPDVAVAEAVPAAVVASEGGTKPFGAAIARAAAAHGLDPKLIEAVIQTESDFDAQAVSPIGAQGLMQLMPGTAADLGVKDAFDPEENIQAGSRYLKQLMDRYHGDAGLALAAYNWGMGNLERNPERMPQETVNYVAKVTGLMRNAA